MRSKDVTIGMKVVPHSKSQGYMTLESILTAMSNFHSPFLTVKSYEKETKSWVLRATGIGVGLIFLAKEFEPYVENENEV